jgi:hypothetical protein
MYASLADIRPALDRLHRSAHRQVFGSTVHDYIVNPPISEDAVAQFEAEHRIALPHDYRAFLTTVGNGGAGPAYGLFELGRMDGQVRDTRWRENDGFVGTLAEPFPHTGPWNDLVGRPVEEDFGPLDYSVENDFDRAYEAFERRYMDPANVNGAIPICHVGCAKRQWLVVTGPEAGHVWGDDRAEDRGLYPLQAPGRPRMTFLQWYTTWLDEALAALASKP